MRKRSDETRHRHSRAEIFSVGVAAFIAASLIALCPTPARAQTFVTYSCDDGTPVVVAFIKGERTMRMQLDGKPLALPQRLSASGARYAKAGVSFWIKGQQATLKRPKKKRTVCNVQ